VSLKRSLKDIGIVGISRIVLSASGIILLPVISKTLGSEGYGLYSQVMVTVGFIAMITGLGLGGSLVRFLPAEKNKKKIQEIFYSSFSVLFLFNLLVLLILLLIIEPLSEFIFDGYKNIALIAIIIIPFHCVNGYSKNFFRGKSEMKKYSLFLIVEKLITLSLIIISIRIGFGILGAIISILISKLLLFTIISGLIIKRIGVKLPNFSKIKELLNYGVPLISTGIFGWVVTSSDRYLISYYLDISAVGIYAAAYGLGIIIYNLSTPIQKALKPNLSRSYDEGNMTDVKHQLKQILRLYLMFAIPSFFGLLALSKPALLLLSTREIALQGYLITPIVALAGVLWGVFGVLYMPIILKKKTKILSLVWGTAAGINFVLNIILIPIYGIIGAGITTLISYSIALFVCVYYSFKFLPIELPWKYISKFLVAGIMMFIVLCIFAPVGLVGLIMRIVIGSGIYFSILYLVNGFREEEKNFIKGKLGFSR